MAIGDRLRVLVAEELGSRSETWARKFADVETGLASPDAVAALAQAGAGVESDSPDSLLSDDAALEQLAVWLVDRVLVDPDAAKNAQRPQFQTGVRVHFDERNVPQPSPRTMDTLAELALGASEETDPRALRIGSPEKVVHAYLRGTDTAPELVVVEVAEAVVTVPAAAAARTRRSTRPAAKPRAAGKKRAASRKKKAPSKKKASSRKKVAKKASARRAAPGKRRSTRRPRKAAPRRRVTAAAKAARRKKK